MVGDRDELMLVRSNVNCGLRVVMWPRSGTIIIGIVKRANCDCIGSVGIIMNREVNLIISCCGWKKCKENWCKTRILS